MQSVPDAGGRGVELPAAPPVVLTIAGFDPSSGAGCTADLKVFAAHGLFGVACPTALTVQSTMGVVRSESVAPSYVRETLECLANDLPIAGIKIGMLGSRPMVEAVADWLVQHSKQRPQLAHPLPIVLDPVLRASSGSMLLTEEGVAALSERLLPLATVLTPNFSEAAVLSGVASLDWASADQAARWLLDRMQPAGSRAVVLTGGDLEDHASAEDFLLLAGAQQGMRLTGKRVATSATHGTGCAFSSAILCGLVQGLAVEDAVRAAKRYVAAAMEAAYALGHGRGPMHHLFDRSLDRTPDRNPDRHL